MRSDKWPEESAEKLPDRGRCRKRPVHAEVAKAAEGINARLLANKQPPLLRAEVIAATLYTGPLFVKCARSRAHTAGAVRLPHA